MFDDGNPFLVRLCFLCCLLFNFLLYLLFSPRLASPVCALLCDPLQVKNKNASYMQCLGVLLSHYHISHKNNNFCIRIN